jgi:hypothetical protein
MVWLSGEPTRKWGQLWRNARETTHSEGGFCGVAVRIKEWKLNQTARLNVTARYCSNPWAIRPNWMWRS